MAKQWRKGMAREEFVESRVARGILDRTLKHALVPRPEGRRPGGGEKVLVRRTSVLAGLLQC